MTPVLALRVLTCFWVLVVASPAWSQARPTRLGAPRSPALRAVRASIRGPLQDVAAAAPGIRRGDRRAYGVRAYRLDHRVPEHDASIAVGRSVARPHPEDDVWYEELVALPRPMQPGDARWDELQVEDAERAPLAALESALRAAVESRPALALFRLRCGWADAPGAAYRGVLVVDRDTHEALWIFGVRSWTGE